MCVIGTSRPLALITDLLTPILKGRSRSGRPRSGSLLAINDAVDIVQGRLLLKLSSHERHTIPVLLASAGNCLASINLHNVTGNFLGMFGG